MCYGISDMSIGHNGTVVCMLCPKISTSLKKLAPTSRHVFATLLGWKAVLKQLGSKMGTEQKSKERNYSRKARSGWQRSRKAGGGADGAEAEDGGEGEER